MGAVTTYTPMDHISKLAGNKKSGGRHFSSLGAANWHILKALCCLFAEKLSQKCYPFCSSIGGW